MNYMVETMKTSMVALAIAFVSCVDPPERSQHTEVWVCHHPGSRHHGKICTDQCLVQEDDSKFCWKLLREDCEVLDREWKRQACHLFE